MKTARVLLMAATAMVSSGCGLLSAGGESSASCAFVVEYEDRRYHDVSVTDFTVGEELGTAVRPACDDTGDSVDNGMPETTTTVYAVEGLDPDIAVAVGDAPADAIFVSVDGSGGGLPPEVQELKAADGS